jgi:hypothetical protein
MLRISEALVQSFYLLNVITVVYAILIGSTYSICRYGEISNTIGEVVYEWRICYLNVLRDIIKI